MTANRVHPASFVSGYIAPGGYGARSRPSLRARRFSLAASNSGSILIAASKSRRAFSRLPIFR